MYMKFEEWKIWNHLEENGTLAAPCFKVELRAKIKWESICQPVDIVSQIYRATFDLEEYLKILNSKEH